MDKKLITVLSILGLIVAAYVINMSIQRGYNSKEKELILVNQNDINKIVISANQDAIELMKIDSTWIISGNDTLNIKGDAIENFFDKIFNLNRKHLVTSKEENWINYGLDEQSGYHLAFINNNGETIAYYVFGRSKTEYNICYVRTNKNSDVYLLDNNIIFQLQTNPTFWGSKPVLEETNLEPIIPE